MEENEKKFKKYNLINFKTIKDTSLPMNRIDLTDQNKYPTDQKKEEQARIYE